MTRHRTIVSRPSQLFSLIIYLFLATQTTLTASAKCKPGPSSQAGSTVPIPLFDVANVFAPSKEPQDPTALAQISHTLALYPLSLDGKDFSQLKNVFFEDAIANYSAPIGVATGLSAIEATVERALQLVTTQHSLGTQTIVLDKSGCKARALTYLTASHFGKGKYEGQVAYAYGEYQDVLAKDGKDWKIQIRILQYQVSDAQYAGLCVGT